MLLIKWLLKWLVVGLVLEGGEEGEGHDDDEDGDERDAAAEEDEVLRGVAVVAVADDVEDAAPGGLHVHALLHVHILRDGPACTRPSSSFLLRPRVCKGREGNPGRRR